MWLTLRAKDAEEKFPEAMKKLSNSSEFLLLEGSLTKVFAIYDRRAEEGYVWDFVNNRWVHNNQMHPFSFYSEIFTLFCPDI